MRACFCNKTKAIFAVMAQTIIHWHCSESDGRIKQQVFLPGFATPALSLSNWFAVSRFLWFLEQRKLSSCTIFFGVSGLHPEIFDVMSVMKKACMIALLIRTHVV